MVQRTKGAALAFMLGCGLLAASCTDDPAGPRPTQMTPDRGDRGLPTPDWMEF